MKRIKSRSKNQKQENERGGTTVEDFLDVVDRSQVPIAERTPSELVNLIKKLRWIGLEEEAAQIQILLRRANAAATLLAGPYDTD
jgi:hypothetical protein